MMNKNRFLGWCLPPTLALLAALAAAAPPLGLTPREGLLLLRNGEVLRGRVARVGEHYHVTLPEGEIRVKPDEMEFFCQDLDEGYRLKREALTDGAAGHVRLADWCLKHALNGYAARELADAIALDPEQPGIRGLTRKLELAREAPVKEEPSAPLPAAVPVADLDQLVASLPQGAMSMFTDTVQPLLSNHCGSAGCHGQAYREGFRLLRMPGSRVPSRRLTQRNLYATMQIVDREESDASPLLTKALEPHGGVAAPVFASEETLKYRQIAAWVRYVAAPDEPQPRTLSESRPHLGSMRAIRRPGEADEPADDEAVSDDASEDSADLSAAGEATLGQSPLPGEAGDRAPDANDDGPALDEATTEAADRRSQRRGPSQSDDPFDPSPYNERFFPEGGE
jgi:hypothetical protein